MDNKKTKTIMYDYRIVKMHDPVIDMATSRACRSIYTIYDCQYDSTGAVVSMSRLDDMTSYSRLDATDFLYRVGAAMTKPVLNVKGEIEEDSLVDPGRVMLSLIGRN